MSVVEQIPIRLQVSTASAPAIAPVDYNTGLPPAVWRAQTAAIAVGIFDAAGDPVSISNLAYLQIILQEAPDSTQALVVKQIDAGADLTELTIGGWRAGTGQNAIFVFSAADLDQNLLALGQRDFWLIVRGFTEDDAPLLYGAGALTIYLASNSLPVTLPKYVSRNKQTTDAGDITVTPNSQVHTEIIEIGGVAREVSAILGINGLQDGARLYLDFTEPATPDIILNLKSGVGTNPTLYTVTTGSVLNGQIALYFDADESTWVVERVTFPAVAY